MNYFDMELMAKAVLDQRASDLAAHRMGQQALAARGPRRRRIQLPGAAAARRFFPGHLSGSSPIGETANAVDHSHERQGA